MNSIFIENYTLVSKHGYYKEEHYKPQRFKVSVYCKVSSNESGKNDSLEETFNYEHIRSCIQKHILGDHKKLLETLAEEISNDLLRHNIVELVEVKITKPDIWGDCEPGVFITRKK